MTQLAQQHRIATATGVSSPFDVNNKLLGGGGILTITLDTQGESSPTKTTSLNIADGATPEAIRDAINTAKAGVSATVVNGTAGKQLVLVSDSVAVSYTHLDVYKRQTASGAATSGNVQVKLGTGGGSAAADDILTATNFADALSAQFAAGNSTVQFTSRAAGAVSYTHLEVYKRQDPERMSLHRSM